MNVTELLQQVKEGSVTIEAAEKQLKNLPYEDLGFAKLDLHRKLRSGSRKRFSARESRMRILLLSLRHCTVKTERYWGRGRQGASLSWCGSVFPGILYDPISRILRIEQEGKRLYGCVAVCTGARRIFRWRRKRRRQRNFRVLCGTVL